MKILPLNDRESGLYNAVIETPKHSQNKYSYDPKSGLFKLKRTLPEGLNFPFDFGFLPQTIAEDEDPIDILLLLDEPGLQGCYLEVRVIGIIEALQTEKQGKTMRNDRVLGVSSQSLLYKDIKKVKELNETVVSQIESFFVNYNRLDGKNFKILNCRGPRTVRALVEKAHKNYLKKSN